MGLPLPPPLKEDRSGELNDDEITVILDSTLKKTSRNDETILRFIEEFVRCKNIAEASANAGISSHLGYRYRHRLDISNAISRIIDKSAVKYGFDASEIMERTKEIVDFDPISVQNADGTFKNNFHDIEPAARRNIKKLKVKNLYSTEKDINGMSKSIIIGEIIEYEFYDKLKAVDLAGKEKEMFKTTTRVEHAVTKDMAAILLESAKRGQQQTLSHQPRIVEAEIISKEDEQEDKH